jgi:hypothetical protein
LSGTVAGAERVVDVVITVRSEEPLSGPWRRGDDEDEDDDEPPVPPRSLFGHVPPQLFERLNEEARRVRHGRGSGQFWTSWLEMGWWKRLFYPAVAVVDAETGTVLRLTRFKGGLPVIVVDAD